MLLLELSLTTAQKQVAVKIMDSKGREGEGGGFRFRAARRNVLLVSIFSHACVLNSDPVLFTGGMWGTELCLKFFANSD